MAKGQPEFNFLALAIGLEKRIETLHITHSMQMRAEQLSADPGSLRQDRHGGTLSNLPCWFTAGISRTACAYEKDEQRIKEFLEEQLPSNAWEQTGFYERFVFIPDL